MASVRHRLDNLASESETPRPTGPESSGTSFRSPSATARNGPVSDAFVNSPLAMRSSSVFPEPPSPFSARVVVVVSPRLSLSLVDLIDVIVRITARGVARERTTTLRASPLTFETDARRRGVARAVESVVMPGRSIAFSHTRLVARGRRVRRSLASRRPERATRTCARASPSATDRGVTPLRASRRVVDVGRGDG